MAAVASGVMIGHELRYVAMSLMPAKVGLNWKAGSHRVLA